MDSLRLGIVAPAFIQSFGQLLYAISFILHVVGFFFHPVQWCLKVHVITPECSGSVVECLTRDQGVAGSSHRRHCVVSLSKTH